MNKLRKFSIKKRLILIVVLSIILPNIFLAGTFNYYSKNQIADNIISTYQNNLLNLESLLRKRIYGVENFMQYMAFDYLAADNQDNLDDQLLIEQKIIKYKNQIPELIVPYVQNLMIISAGGAGASSMPKIGDTPLSHDHERFMNTYGDKEMYHVSNRPLWHNTIKQKHMYYYSQSPNIYISNYITVTMCIERVGLEDIYLIITLTPHFFEDLYNDILYNEESFYILKQDEIIGPLNQGPLLNLELNNILTDIHFDKDVDTIFVNNNMKSNGRRSYIVSYIRTTIEDWSIVGIVPEEQAYTNIYNLRNKNFYITAIIVSIAVIIAMFIAESISKPINRLKDAMTQVGSNTLELDFKDKGNDEIAELTHSFTEMLVRINYLTKTIVNTQLAKKNEEILRKEYELRALQMQIKPHFLYNTLDIIRWNSITLENKAECKEHNVSNMVFYMSKMLSYGANSERNIVSIYEELEHVNSYLKLLHHTKKWNIKFILADSVEKHLQKEIVHLTLQPLIENAVLHGLKNNQQEHIIKLSIHINAGSLVLSLQDNGRGIAKEKLDKINDGLQQGTSKRIGLANVDSRLKLYFGEKYGITLYSEEDKFTNVSIKIPY